MTDPQPIDEELLRMAGNPKIAEAVKESLRRLSAGAGGPDLAEMAKELLAGRTSLHEIGRSAAYAAPLTESFTKFRQWQSELSPEDRQELDQKTREILGGNEDMR